jgi:hypothetical protein
MAKGKIVLAYYNGKIIDMASYVTDPKSRFHLAAMRITDNNAEGYVIETSSKSEKVYFISKASRMAKIVHGEERDRVLAEILSQVQQPEKLF